MSGLQPRKRKYKHNFKKVPKTIASRGFLVKGDFGLKAMAHGRITARQLEACRSAIRRYAKRAGKLEMRIFPHFSISSKPAETRMGKGKGSVSHYVAMVRPGAIMFDMSGVSIDVAKGAFALASAKLPIKSKFVTKQNFA